MAGVYDRFCGIYELASNTHRALSSWPNQKSVRLKTLQNAKSNILYTISIFTVAHNQLNVSFLPAWVGMCSKNVALLTTVFMFQCWVWCNVPSPNRHEGVPCSLTILFRYCTCLGQRKFQSRFCIALDVSREPYVLSMFRSRWYVDYDGINIAAHENTLFFSWLSFHSIV